MQSTSFEDTNKRTGLPYFVHTPSLVQHIGDTSIIWKTGFNQGRRRASDFIKDLQSDK